MNSLYNIFNNDYINQKAMEQQNHHNEQMYNVADSVKKLKDFLDSTDKIEPEYMDVASANFCAVLFNYFQRHNKQ